MVDQYSINSAYFNKIRNIFHQGLLYPWPCRIVRIALAALFIYGGVIKLLAPKAFAATISAYDLAPEVLLPLLAVGLPLIETIAGLALLLDRPWGLHLITVQLALFVFVLGYGIFGDLDVDCGCFGADELDKRAALRVAFYRDMILIGVVAPYLYLSRRVRELAESREEKRLQIS
ncbi:MAG: MauE/DoxX family redox-associated membrane protein [Deltaproteobacteria bacterium]